MTAPNSYTFPVAWTSSISGIISGALALGGFEVSGSLSYQASLTNLTATGANIVVTPDNLGTETVLLQFDVLLVTECGA